MPVIEFPRRPRTPRARSRPRPFDLARQMEATRDRRKAVAAERQRLISSLARLERLSAELESIQSDLERLRDALSGPASGSDPSGGH